MSIRDKLIQIAAENDQDQEHGRQFFRDNGYDRLMLVWRVIMETCEKPSPDNIVGRLAQLKFCELVVEKAASDKLDQPTE